MTQNVKSTAPENSNEAVNPMPVEATAAPDMSQGLTLMAIGRDGGDQRDERLSGRGQHDADVAVIALAAPPERVRQGATGLGAFANLCRPGGWITPLATAAAGSTRGTGQALCGCGWRQGVPR